jgi:putative transposase
MEPPPAPHCRYRFPTQIISYAARPYHLFSLGLQDVELRLAERGIVVSCETVRRWCRKFGEGLGDRLRRHRPPPGDKWHLGEVFIRIQGVQHCLRRTVDQHGVVVDTLAQGRRNASAAKRFFKRLLKGPQYVPRVIVIGKLRRYGVAQQQLLTNVEHRQSRYFNNCAEISHRPTRRREVGIKLQILRAGAEFPLRACICPWLLPSTPILDDCHQLPCHPFGGIQCLQAGDARTACRVTRTTSTKWVPCHLRKVNLTMATFT